MLECIDKGYISLISYFYSNPLAPYLGTAIFTIFYLYKTIIIIILPTTRRYVILLCVTNTNQCW